MSGFQIQIPPKFRTRGFHGGSKKGRNIGPADMGVNSAREAGARAMSKRFPSADPGLDRPPSSLCIGPTGGYQIWF